MTRSFAGRDRIHAEFTNQALDRYSRDYDVVIGVAGARKVTKGSFTLKVNLQ
jgi:hypothetical protein